MTERILGHFTFLKFTDTYWQFTEPERAAVRWTFLTSLAALDIQTSLYQVFPLNDECDFLLWSSLRVVESDSFDHFFSRYASFLNAQRSFIQPERVWWGFTRPSDYSRGNSSQEIDPFDGDRRKYLTIYPFTKSTDWYQLTRDSRQGMMNEHIRTGHQYPQIKQLLLYSTGLQDQEFIVVYEMDNLTEFSALVTDLRSSDARRYTLQDTPIFSAIYRTPEETLDLFK